MRVSKSASQLTGRCGKERDQARKNQSESEVSRKDRESGNASVCSCVVVWVLILPMIAEKEQLQYSAVTLLIIRFLHTIPEVGGKQKSDIHAPKSSVRHKRNLFMCGFDVPLTQ